MLVTSIDVFTNFWDTGDILGKVTTGNQDFSEFGEMRALDYPVKDEFLSPPKSLT